MSNPARLSFAVSDYLAATVSVLTVEGSSLIVDPGFEVAPSVERILDTHGSTPVGVLITHGHLDHVADASYIASAWDIPVYVGEGDSQRLDDPLAGLPSAFTTAIKVRWEERGWSRPASVIEVSHGTRIPVGPAFVTARANPGHTEGSTTYVFDGEVAIEALVGVTPKALTAPAAAFTGDFLFAGTIGRTDLRGGDSTQMLTSLREARAWALERVDTVIVPGHGALSTLGEQLASNYYLGPQI